MGAKIRKNNQKTLESNKITSRCYTQKRSASLMCHTNKSQHSTSDTANALRASSHFNEAQPIFLACATLWESCKLFPRPEHLHFERRGPVRDERPLLFLDPGPSMGIGSPQALKMCEELLRVFLGPPESLSTLYKARDSYSNCEDGALAPECHLCGFP